MIKIGFTCGAFDLFHAGHMLMLKEAKEQCTYLIVGLQVDPSVDRLNKNKPIQSLEERRVQLESCKYVDKVIVYETERDLLHLLMRIKPNIRIIGADWKGKAFTGWELNIPVFYNSRNHSYSSSNLRRRVFEAEARKLK